MDLQNLAHRPAGSITDAEVAEAIAVVLSDARVTKAVHIGRENGAADGRQMIDFEMTGFSGVHTLGRVISALGEEERVNAAASAKQATVDAKAAKKNAADMKDLAAAVPRPGKNGKFEAHLKAVGKSDAEGDDRVELYVAYMLPRMAGLTGTIAQRVWAADIREGYTSRFDDSKRAKIFKKHKAAKFWIEGQRSPSFSNVLEAVK